MSNEHPLDPCAQLAQTRQEIAKWLNDQPLITPTDAASTTSMASASSHVLAGLLLIAIAEHVLKRSAKLPTHTTTELVNLQHAKGLLHASTRQHPAWMLALTAFAGAAFVATRPWRWLARKDMWMGLLSQVLITGFTYALEKKSNTQTPSDKGHE